MTKEEWLKKKEEVLKILNRNLGLIPITEEEENDEGTGD